MHVGIDDLEAIRQEILGLLRQQMEALDSPSGLTDDQLRECYVRQGRIQELREVLQAASVAGERQNVPQRDAAEPRYRDSLIRIYRKSK